jgi:hypothetical protein
MAQKLSDDDVARIAELDDTRKTMFFRDPLRPDAKFIKSGRRVPPEVKKAQGRMRTARWRSAMDQRKAPTAETIGMALAVALATTSRLADLTPEDCQLVQRALHFLRANGFDIGEAKRTLRRMRIRLVDPADREGEESESCGPPIRPTGFPEPLF